MTDTNRPGPDCDTDQHRHYPRPCKQCEQSTCNHCSVLCYCCRAYICTWCTERNGHTGFYARCNECLDHEEERYPLYHEPYLPQHGPHRLTIGIEIEISGTHSHPLMTGSDLVAGWCDDISLEKGGREYQTHPLATNPETLAKLHDLIAAIVPEYTKDHAGGHIHVSRTPRQTRGRWLRALAGLDHDKAAWLNMRHADPDNNRWCRPDNRHDGKRTAVNDEHGNTIELRTFGPWNADSVNTLMPAIHWIRTMWRFFENHPDLIRNKDIEATSRTAWANAVPAIAKKGNR